MKREEDELLRMFQLDTKIHENAIQHALDKGFDISEADVFFQPECWDLWADMMWNGEFETKPTTEHYICKKTGNNLSYEEAKKRDFVEVRKIYVMTKPNRVAWNAIYQVLYHAFSYLIHDRCCSYKKGESTRKVIQRVVKEVTDNPEYYGSKRDLVHYFDSVPIEEIDKLFDKLEKLKPSCLWKVIRDFYHDNRVIINGEQVEKYCSLKQGCAVSAFLSNLVLADVDEYMSKQPVIYYRYSDDCIILGSKTNSMKAAYDMQKLLEAKGLSFNEKKTEYFSNKRWVTFLGFKFRGTQVTLSKDSLEHVTHKIKEETIFKCKQLHRALTKGEIIKAIDKIQYYLFIGCKKSNSGMCGYLFGGVNDVADLTILDSFAKDCIRAALTNKCDIYGLSASYGEHGIVKGGFDKNGRFHKGRNVAMNLIKTDRMVEELGWYSLVHMFKKYHQGTDVYKAEVNKMRNGECYGE